LTDAAVFAGISVRSLRALRANRVLATDEKRIRSQNTVIDKSSRGLGLCLCEIGDGPQTVFHPRNFATLQKRRARFHFPRIRWRQEQTSDDAASSA
jgi:hypothetical protein